MVKAKTKRQVKWMIKALENFEDHLPSVNDEDWKVLSVFLSESESGCTWNDIYYFKDRLKEFLKCQ